MNHDRVSRDNLGYGSKKPLTIRVVQKDWAALVAARHDVIDRALELDADWARHLAQPFRSGENVVMQDLTPIGEAGGWLPRQDSNL